MDERQDGADGRLRLGVTGHRRLPDDPALEARIGEAIERAQEIYRACRKSAGGLVICSSLAEGADRLVACVALRQSDARLSVPLPLPPDEYGRDFASPASHTAFKALLAQASEVVVLPRTPNREDAYLAAGLFVLRHCDALLAVWDGMPARGPGGTGAIVVAARLEGLPLLWVESTPPYTLHVERIEALGLHA